MSHVNRWVSLIVIPFALGLAVGCSSSSSKDAGTDVVTDVPTDVLADVPVDVPVDAVRDANPEDPGIVADVVADTPSPDALPDVAWDTLPTLPASMSFTLPIAAGTGQKDVSPTQPTHLGGFGFCMGDETVCRSTDGVHDPLMASAVAFADTATKEVVIFIGVDTIGVIRADIDDMHDRIQKRLYDEFGVFFDGRRAIIGASHAHSSCDTVGLWGPGYGAGRQEQYVELFKNGVVEAARDAYASLKDVTLDWGMDSSWVNSSEDIYAHDQDLYVMRGKGTDTKTMFTLVRFPAHPTTYGSDMREASADWVGTMRKKLQDDLGGINVFLNGPNGSVYPNRPDTCGLTEEAFPNGDRAKNGMNPADYMKTTCTGYGIAAVAEAALQAATPVVTTGGVTFKHSIFQFHPTNGTLMMLAQVGPLPFEYVDVDDPNAMMHSEFSVATVGDLTYVTTPGESFPSFGQEAKDIATEANLLHPITLGLAQDWMGYLMIVKQWSDSSLSYNQSLSPGPDVEPSYMAALRVLLGLPAATTK